MVRARPPRALLPREGNIEHFISDNGSTDDTVAMVKRISECEGDREWKEFGIWRGNNTAFWQSTGEFVLFLNPDNIVRPGSLKILYNYMLAHPKVGIVGPKLVDQFGKINKDALPRRFQSFRSSLYFIKNQ